MFQPRLGTPFWHLNNEPFWRLVSYEGGDGAIAMHLQGNPYAPSTTRKLIRYAEIDKELFDLLQDKTNRAKLRTILIKHYNKINIVAANHLSDGYKSYLYASDIWGYEVSKSQNDSICPSQLEKFEFFRTNGLKLWVC